jgi:hypothetical protein
VRNRLVGLLLLVMTATLYAAPAPFPKTTRAKSLCKEQLVGSWIMHWSNVRSRVMFSRDGTYICHWPGAEYTGSWGVDSKGQLWITETSYTSEPKLFQSYTIELDPRTLCGPVKHGASCIWVRLEKQP